MEKKRLKHIIRLWLTLGSVKRAAYLRSHHVFGAIGENCSIMDRNVPLYANLIRIGDNVHIASKVDFITHDITHVMLNNLPYVRNICEIRGGLIPEKIGCIEIKNNVFIGSKTTILGNVRVGSNVIIAAGSLVNKDIPDNSVVAGIPAKVIGKFDHFVQKRIAERNCEIKVVGQMIPKELESYFWEEFEHQRWEIEC